MENKITFKGATRYWWVPLITGILSIAIGIWCFLSPAESLLSLAYAFAIIIIAAGLFNMGFGFSNTGRYPGWGWSMGLGILELICGIWMLTMSPAVMTTVFVYAVGFYIIFACINAICDACTFYGYANDWFGWIIAILLITLLFAVLFLTGPVAGGIAVWLYIGISFILFGIYRLILSAKIKRINNRFND